MGEWLFSAGIAIMVPANMMEAYTGDFNPIFGFPEMIFQCFMYQLCLQTAMKI